MISNLRYILNKRLITIAWYGPRIVACFLVRHGLPSAGLSVWRFATKGTPDMQNRLYPLLSVDKWVEIKQQQSETVIAARKVSLEPVYRYGLHLERNDMHAVAHEVDFPPVKLTILKNAYVVGGTEMVISEDGTLLYDELALGDPDRYGVKAWGIIPALPFGGHLPAATRNKVLISYWQGKVKPTLPCAISLTKDHSRNYYHWMLECLPRALVAVKKPEFADYPLLVDENLPPQILESLRLVAPERKIIPVMSGMAINVKELVFPSVFSYPHDFYGRDTYIEDLLISPDAIRLVREALLPLARVNKYENHHNGQRKNQRNGQPNGHHGNEKENGGSNAKRRIYLARSGGTHRALTNEAELIEMLEKIGFTVVHPGKLSLLEQISLFSSAEIIVGPTGAGMTNIIFAPTECKILILAGATRHANYYIFAQIAQALGQTLSYVTGKPGDRSNLHSHYFIHPLTLRFAIEEAIMQGEAFV